MKAQGGVRGIALLLDARRWMGVGGQRHALAALPPGTAFVGGWVVNRPVVDGCRKLAPTGIQSPDRPARSESL